MEFAYILAICLSLVILFAVFVYARKNNDVAGTKAFLWQIVFVIVWSVGSLLEMLSPTEKGMVFWRNIEQIGVFLLPVACVYFAVNYARYDRLKKYLPYLLIVPLIAVALIFTDSVTHIMRRDYIVSYSPLFGRALSVHVTFVGMLFLAYNVTVSFVSLLTLFVFSRQIAKNMRRQVMFVLLATGLVFLFAVLKNILVEGTRINIPIVTLYLPGSLIIFYNLYKHNFLYVSPIARDKVFDVIEQGIVVTDNMGVIVDKNPFAQKLLSSYFSVQEELVGKKLVEVIKDYPQWAEYIQNNAVGELEVRKDNEEPHYIHISVYPLQSHKGTAVGAVTIMRDTTAVRLQELTLKQKAEMDSLTGLLNRDGFMNAYTRMISESRETGDDISVLMMDIDEFKGINDTFGHDSGDRVIAAFAELLRGVLRRKDTIGRIGGDEFAAVLPGVGRLKAMEIAQRILKEAEERVIHLEEEKNVGFTLSIGICANEVVTKAEDMLKCADKAMYTAKNKMRNCCVAWE